MNRRTFLQASAGLIALGGCSSPDGSGEAGSPRLTSRPRTVARTLASGTTRTVATGTSLVAHLPESAIARPSVPLMVFLHGAGRTVEPFMDRFRPIADATGVMLLMPYSVNSTWDAIRGSFGNDIAGINDALHWAFNGVNIDPQRIVLSGFSDGATYTLAVGRANGDLFSKVIAYSPGFLIPVAAQGRPPIVISHGTQDQVLPYDYTTGTIVPNLQQQGYAVDFRSFVGNHAVPTSVVEEQMQLLSGGDAPA